MTSSNSSSNYSTISSSHNSSIHSEKNNAMKQCNNNNNISQSLGLVVTAKQVYYPIELSNSELLNHYETVQEYQLDIASNIIQQSSKCNPSTKLISQQPEINPLVSRNYIINFLYKLSNLSKVVNGVFFHAVRLFDRYCSKRIVLKDQINLILGTCLWLSAKTYGGCNHIINNVVIPTGGRFYGPNPRARIPRLNELVYFCSDSSSNSTQLDESMFLQMERHILDTLNWEVYEPSINDYILNVDENCLIQYELYQRQSMLCNNNNSNSSDNDELNDKINLIHLKNFLINLICWQFDLLNFELFELTAIIFELINKFTNEIDQSSLLDFPPVNTSKQFKILNCFINAICNNIPDILVNNYKEHTCVLTFINNIKLYQLQQQQSTQNKITLNTHHFGEISSVSSPTTSLPSPMYSNHSSTPLRNISGTSENSVFSTIMDNNSPLTPSIYNKNDSAWDSSLSVVSQGINKRNYDDVSNNMGSNKENVVPPRSKFLNTGLSSSSSNNSSKTSLISLTIGQNT